MAQETCSAMKARHRFATTPVFSMYHASGHEKRTSAGQSRQTSVLLALLYSAWDFRPLGTDAFTQTTPVARHQPKSASAISFTSDSMYRAQCLTYYCIDALFTEHENRMALLFFLRSAAAF